MSPSVGRDAPIAPHSCQIGILAHSCCCTLAVLLAIFAALAPSPTQAATWKSNAGGDITEATNWDGDAAPAAGDTLDFSAITSAQTLTGAFDDDRAFSTATFGTGVVTLEGSLHFTTLTNANKLAIASSGVLHIDEDLAAFQYVYNKYAYMTFLYSNEGEVTVGRYAVGGADSSGCGNYGYVRQYETHTSASTPIKANGIYCYIVYTTSPLFYLAHSSADGEWIVGSGGLPIFNGQNNDRVNFRVEGIATIRSTADWTLGKSAKNGVNKDLYVTGSRGSLVIDTTDYDDGTTPRTATLEGRLVADVVQDAATVTIAGCGTNVIATAVTYGDNKSTKIENAIAVTDTATLQVNAGASYIISNIVVSSGATLYVPSTAVNTSAMTIIENVDLADGASVSLPSTSDAALTARALPLTLPEEGVAYLRIDGPALKKGEYAVLSPVPDGYAEHLSVLGTALGGRSVRLSDDGESLKVVIPPKGFVIVFK